jgi:very-short-patch-repair endonuclease
MKELEKPMYYGAKSGTVQAARLLRKNMTSSEKRLWERLNHKQIRGLRFRRQHPIDFFIADFYCHEVKLVVEIDGDIHLQRKEYDNGRSAEMEKHGIKIIRFNNSDVEDNIEMVIKQIEGEVKFRQESPANEGLQQYPRKQSPPWGI